MARPAPHIRQNFADNSAVLVVIGADAKIFAKLAARRAHLRAALSARLALHRLSEFIGIVRFKTIDFGIVKAHMLGRTRQARRVLLEIARGARAIVFMRCARRGRVQHVGAFLLKLNAQARTKGPARTDLARGGVAAPEPGPTSTRFLGLDVGKAQRRCTGTLAPVQTCCRANTTAHTARAAAYTD